MKASNDWNSKFLINKLAQLTQDTKLVTPTEQQQEDRREEGDITNHKFGKLVDLDETASSEENTVNSPEEKSSAGSETDTSGFTFTFSVKPMIDVVKREDVTVQNTDKKLEKKHSYETKHIRCTLNDLLLGMDSPVVRKVILNLRGEEEDQESKEQQQHQQQQTTNSGSKISYSPNAEEFVPLARQRTLYSPKAKEFVPMRAEKYNPEAQEYAPPVKYSPSAKEFVPASNKYSVDAKEFVPFTIKSSVKKYNVIAKKFVP